MVDFIAHLGWSPKLEQEQQLLTMDKLIAVFSLEGVNKKGAKIDHEKLMWLNKQHFRLKLQNPSELQQLTRQLQYHLRDHFRSLPCYLPVCRINRVNVD